MPATGATGAMPDTGADITPGLTFGSINSWGAKTICDAQGTGPGIGYGGAAKSGVGGGAGGGGFVEISPGAVASGVGVGAGGFATYGGFGGCIVYPISRSCSKECP